MGQERSLCIVISQYTQVSYIRYGTWLDEMAIPNMAALREGCAASRSGPRPEARRFPLSATPQQGGKRSWEYARCIPPLQPCRWTRLGVAGSPDVGDVRWAESQPLLASLPKTSTSVGFGPGAVPGAGGGRPSAHTGTRARPRSTHFGDGMPGSAEHGLSIMVERVSLVAGPGRRRQGPEAAGHVPPQLP